jgi:2-deoxy-D-gluconate 3-dehydrogenase
MKVLDLFDLSDKKALVTGGSYGLGKAFAKALSEAGAQVGIIDISEKLDATIKELSSRKKKLIGIKANLADRKDRKAAFDKFIKAFGTIDILVNNAGITKRHPAEKFPMEDWDAVMEINLNAVFDLCQMAGKVMLAKGSGKIINIASLLSFSGGLTVPAYAASKGGVTQLTKALSNEWAGKGIHVNAIAPGYMDTPLNTALKKDRKRVQSIIERIPAGRWGKPEDLMGAIVFLASSASDYMSGAILLVDGGFLGR